MDPRAESAPAASPPAERGAGSAAIDLTMRLARALHAYGTPAHLLEEALRRVAQRLDLSEAQCPGYRCQHCGTQQDLGRPQSKDHSAQHPKSRRLQLQPDNKQQENDPQLGEMQYVIGILNQLHAVRADNYSGGEIAQYGAKSEAPADRHHDDRCQ
jgi:hypothetical protein